jgi:hypothetical protein
MIPEYRVELVARENLPLVLPHVQARLERVLAEGNGEYGFGELVQQLVNGRSQLWLGYSPEPRLKMIGVTAIVSHPNVKRLRFELIEG